MSYMCHTRSTAEFRRRKSATVLEHEQPPERERKRETKKESESERAESERESERARASGGNRLLVNIHKVVCRTSMTGNRETPLPSEGETL